MSHMSNNDFDKLVFNRKQEAMRDPVYHILKNSVIESLWRYAVYGIEAGGFLNAVLENNLKEAFARADDDNARAMKTIVMYVYMKMPSNCWGSITKVESWITSHAILRKQPHEETAHDSN